MDLRRRAVGEVAEVTYTAFAHTKDRITARLVVRRVKDARYPDALFPIWRHHPLFTNSTLPTAHADITHRRHAIIETVFADLIDGPLVGPLGQQTEVAVAGEQTCESGFGVVVACVGASAERRDIVPLDPVGGPELGYVADQR